MSALPFSKEITEVSATKFADCPLGKLAENKTSDISANDYDKPLGLICENIKNCPIEGNNGHWEGERGDSKWVPEPDAIPKKCNTEGKMWKLILDKYGIDGIEYKDGEPDLSKTSKGNVEISGFSDKRDDNFDKADIELAKQRGCSPEEVKTWRKENGYTWHECKDMKTMQKVPSEVHNNISHRGGVSEAKSSSNE